MPPYATAADVVPHISEGPVAYADFGLDARKAIPASPGLYAITDGPDGRLLAVGRTTPGSPTLRAALMAHAPGGRGREGSQLHLVAGDLMVVPQLSPIEMAQVARSQLLIGQMVHELVRERWWYRWEVVDDPDDAPLIRELKPLLCWPVRNGPREPWSPAGELA